MEPVACARVPEFRNVIPTVRGQARAVRAERHTIHGGVVTDSQETALELTLEIVPLPMPQWIWLRRHLVEQAESAAHVAVLPGHLRQQDVAVGQLFLSGLVLLAHLIQ